MPELPEVETVRSDLHERVVGRSIIATTATGIRTVRRSSPWALIAATEDRRVVGTGRHGKWLWLTLDDDGCVLIHLRMSGQVLWADAETPRPLHTHVTFALDCGHELRFVDPRTFGEVIALPSMDAAIALIAQGPDAMTITPEQLAERLARRKRALKTVLLDQKAVAGVGNIYADEIAHRAGLKPTRTNLSGPAVGRVHTAMREVLGAAIEARGSSLADEQYVDLSGRIGGFQLQHRVHAREVCGSCGGNVKRLVMQGRSAYFCSICQR
jgi:formamidopyrimidine-DNA glycosylase